MYIGPHRRNRNQLDLPIGGRCQCSRLGGLNSPSDSFLSRGGHRSSLDGSIVAPFGAGCLLASNWCPSARSIRPSDQDIEFAAILVSLESIRSKSPPRRVVDRL